jgi:hypothetical protein
MICDKGRLAEYDYRLYHRVVKYKPQTKRPEPLPPAFQPPHVKLAKAPRRKA